MSDEFQSHEILTATKLNRALKSGRCIARARRITSSTTSTGTTRIPVLRIDDIALTAGRLYNIRSGVLQCDGATANDGALVEMTYTTDGSTPTISSTVLPGGSAEIVQPNTGVNAPVHISTTYTPATDETLSILMTFRHSTGTGAMGLVADGGGRLIEFGIYDQGEDPGDTGVDL
jgi:hypothetical protein